MRRMLVSVVSIILLALVIVGCVYKITQPVVHMGLASFTPNVISIHTGDSVTLENNSPATHVISNGSWGASDMIEMGGPVVNGQEIKAGGSIIKGPFTMTGTYNYYCTIHQGMNLTIVVQ